ncbi:zinc-dependent metalloprotease family protein [Lentzea sp. NBRC 105346]|uniref:zinc-dependent metalloprotease family protein n=1 Tax=Lentzea sp. NBRC 105346 TaxID=3032205 RepID=UPI002557A807|nr:zinc-dependent metalloprotease family protein [Lentzea sp. NBRC 105346]
MTRILLAVVALLATAVPSASAKPLPVVDVLVLYTPKSVETYGGLARLREISAKNEAITNESFRNSKAKVRVRVVGLEPAPDYNLDGKPEADAAYDYLFHKPESAAALRDKYKADVMHLLAADVGGFSNSQTAPVAKTSPGAGKMMLVGYDRPYLVLGFTHELGHLLGLDHDKYVGGGRFPGYEWARGYVAPSMKWRTVMAYEDKCRDAGVECPDIPYFSNPSLTYQGERLGQPKGSPEEADEVSMLDESAPIVAAYR